MISIGNKLEVVWHYYAASHERITTSKLTLAMEASTLVNVASETDATEYRERGAE